MCIKEKIRDIWTKITVKCREGKWKERIKAFTQTSWFEWVAATVCAAIICLVIFSVFVAVISVHGDSMVPTYTSGDRVIVNRLSHKYEYGDVVVIHMKDSFDFPGGATIIKRVIATEGQTVSFSEDGTVVVDGVEETAQYWKDAGMAEQEPVTVPEGCVYVLGDNREWSYDSRYFGCVDVDNIVGKVFLYIGHYADNEETYENEASFF